MHGVLFLNIQKIVQEQLEEGDHRFEHLEKAFATCSESKVPNEYESSAIEAFVDKFITCSLRNPMTRKIANSVQCHNHTFTCSKRSSKCRFNFPRFPSLYTQVAVPLRLIFGEDEKGKAKELQKMRTVLHKVRQILESKDIMIEVNKIYQDEIEEIIEENELYLKAKHILDDHIFKKQICDFNEDFDGKVTFENTKLGDKLVENLKYFCEEHEAKYKLLEKADLGYRKERLLKVLRSAQIEEDLEIDKDLDHEEKECQLIAKYHEILKHSVKGFTVNLKRDTNECFVNNFNHEWLSVWNANMDVSCVFDFFAILVYVRQASKHKYKGIINYLLL